MYFSDDVDHPGYCLLAQVGNRCASAHRLSLSCSNIIVVSHRHARTRTVETWELPCGASEGSLISWQHNTSAVASAVCTGRDTQPCLRYQYQLNVEYKRRYLDAHDNLHTQTHTNTHALSLFHTHTHAHTHMQTYAHTRACARTHTHTHTRTRITTYTQYTHKGRYGKRWWRPWHQGGGGYLRQRIGQWNW